MIDPVKEIRALEACRVGKTYVGDVLTAARRRIEVLESALSQIREYPANDHSADAAIPLTGLIITARQALKDTGHSEEPE